MPVNRAKTKVQAQRKFAQGAYVPSQLVPANNVTPQDVRREKIERKDIIRNKTSAKNLLDIVSFQRHHKHKKLIVVIQRLEETNVYASVAKDRNIKSNNKMIETKNEIKDNLEKVKKTKFVNKGRHSMSMRLRSQATSKMNHMKRQGAPDTKKPRVKKQKIIKSSVSEISDDSIPLSRVKKQTGQVQSCPRYNKPDQEAMAEDWAIPASMVPADELINNNSIPVVKEATHPYGHIESQVTPTNIKEGEAGVRIIVNAEDIPEVAGNQTEDELCEEIVDGSPNNEEVQKNKDERCEGSVDGDEGYQKEDELGEITIDGVLNNEEQMNEDELGEPNVDAIAKDEDDMGPLLMSSDSEEPIGTNVIQISYVNEEESTYSLKALEELDEAQMVEVFAFEELPNDNAIHPEMVEQRHVSSVARSPTTPQPRPAETVAHTSMNEDEPQAGPSGLNPNDSAWIVISSDDSNDETNDDHRGPYYTKSAIHRWVKRGKTSTPSAPALCPAKKWVTLKDVVSASNEDVAKRCNKCRQCSRVNKLFKLSALLKKQKTIDCSDGQESQMQDDKNIQRHLYMELLPSHQHLMIKLKIQQVHQNKILSARLIPRCDAKISEDILLKDHEDLVDEFTNMLMYSLRERSSNMQGIYSDVTCGLKTPRPSDAAVAVDIGESPTENVAEESGAHTTQRPTALDQANTQINTDRRQPRPSVPASITNSPVFRPTQEEFHDPIAYFEKIAPTASRYGLCKVVPPEKFTPTCNLNEEIRFDSTNQYISKLFCRWGPAARELCAIKTCVNSTGVQLSRAPLLDGLEINLPKLHHVVQKNGGIEKVISEKRWRRVADDMGLNRAASHERKLQLIYMKYLLPYDSVANTGRTAVIRKVETSWKRRYRKMLDRAVNPLHRQKKLLGESESSGDETEEERVTSNALSEAEDCIVSGSCMNLTKFKRIAATAFENHFRASSDTPTTAEVEQQYWAFVLLGTEHICVNTASIDTGDEGYGFSKKNDDLYTKHPWNLKMLSQNGGNILGSLGPVLGLTVPTLHLGMVFSTSCWHRDPHALPWIEYMHQGPSKIWYGIPDEQSEKFRAAVETLCPTSCQNKSIWLPSDITMIPPNLLLEHNVSLSRIEQKPGEFIIVFPKAYSCSISSGYTVSESVYFATNSWLNSVDQVFQELRESCEPTMFSLEQLLLAVGTDARTPLAVLQRLLATLSALVGDELDYRRRLTERGLPFRHVQDRENINKRKRNTGAWNIDECDICRTTLYLSKVSELPHQVTSFCLQHALRLLDTKRDDKETIGDLQVTVYLSTEELTTLMKQVHSRLTAQKTSTD